MKFSNFSLCLFILPLSVFFSNRNGKLEFLKEKVFHVLVPSYKTKTNQVNKIIAKVCRTTEEFHIFALDRRLEVFLFFRDKKIESLMTMKINFSFNNCLVLVSKNRINCSYFLLYNSSQVNQQKAFTASTIVL